MPGADGRVDKQKKKLLVVAHPNTVCRVDAVVVHPCYTCTAPAAMVCPVTMVATDRRGEGGGVL